MRMSTSRASGTQRLHAKVNYHTSKGFDVPVSESVNANWYDDAYAELVRRTNGAVHDIRNNDYDFGNARWKPSPKCMGTNGVNELLWGPKALTCPWSPAVPQLLRDLDL